MNGRAVSRPDAVVNGHGDRPTDWPNDLSSSPDRDKNVPLAEFALVQMVISS